MVQDVVIPEVFCRESKLKDNGSSTKDLEDDVSNELLSKVHKHVNLCCFCFLLVRILISLFSLIGRHVYPPRIAIYLIK